METSKCKFFLQDIKNRTVLSFKLMIRNKITMLVLVLSIISTIVLLQQLNEGVKTKSSIPVGVVNLDIDKINMKNSDLSQELITGLSKVDAISVHESTFDILYEQLVKGEVYSIFVLNDGFERKLRDGDFKELITVYQGSESKTARLLKDIIAGELMYQLCLTKGSNLYQNLEILEEHKFSVNEYSVYANALRNSSEFDFQFNMQFVNAADVNDKHEALNNQLLYRQLIGAIFAMLLSFVILYATTYLTIENGQGLGRRVKLAGMNKIAEFVGNLCSICLLVFILCVVFSGFLCYYIGTFDMFASIMKVSYCYTIILGILFILLGVVFKNIISFQLFGAFIILLFGLGGFYSIIGGVAQYFTHLARLSPNSWFIKKIVDIILYH